MAELNVFQELQVAIAEDTAWRDFATGVEIPNKWIDLGVPNEQSDPMSEGRTEYNIPMIVMDYREVELPGGQKCTGAILMQKFTTPRVMNFYDIQEWLKKDGQYVAGCSTELYRAVTSTVIKTEDDDGTVKHKVRQFFLPTMGNLHVDVKGNLSWLEASTWGHFQMTPTSVIASCEERAFCNPMGVPQAYWSGSADRKNANNAWSVGKDGRALRLIKYAERPCIPACVVIGKSLREIREG